MNDIIVSTFLCNLLIVCFCVVMVSWAVVAIQTAVTDHRREKREVEAAERDKAYHERLMQGLDQK